MNKMPTAERIEKLNALRVRLKTGEYDGNDIMQAWIAIDRIAELEAQLADANEMLEKCNSKFIVALEAEVKTLRESGTGLIGILEEILYAVSIDKSCNARVRAIAATLEQQIKTVREGK